MADCTQRDVSQGFQISNPFSQTPIIFFVETGLNGHLASTCQPVIS